MTFIGRAILRHYAWRKLRLLEQRRKLLDLKFARTATDRDLAKLEAVRAELDEFELAEMDPAFARLERELRV